MIKFMFSKKATKMDEIFTNPTVTTNCQTDGEDFFNFCGLFRKHEFYGVDHWICKKTLIYEAAGQSYKF